MGPGRNPKDRFSHNVAHIGQFSMTNYVVGTDQTCIDKAILESSIITKETRSVNLGE